MGKIGAILFVGMKDFMTFRDVSFSPGPGFNVVLGPNGAGKSSIVSAITLGLGGDVVTLRRQTNLADFVNSEVRGVEHAEILIRLRRTERGDEAYEVLCKVYKTNRSEFWLDGKRVSKQAVASLAQELQIQTNNLCQFLPQDVVREFPEMSPERIFVDTVRAVGDHATLDQYASLKTRQVECEQLRETIDIRKNTLLVLEKRDANSDRVRQAEESRKKLTENIELHELQAKYLAIKILREDVRKKQKEKKALEEQHASADKTVAAMKNNLKGYREEKVKLEKILKANKAVVEASSRGMFESNVRKIEAEVENLSRDIRSLDDRLFNREQQVMEEEERFHELESELQKFNKKDLDAVKFELLVKQGEASLRCGNHKDSLRHFENELRAAELNSKNLAQKRLRISSDEVLKLNLLRQRNHDAFEGVEWLRKNRHTFIQNVYEPIMMNLQLGDPSYACYVQKIIGAQDLEAFVCECAEDTNKLMNSLRLDRRLRRINVIQSSPDGCKLQSPEVPTSLNSSLIDFVDGMIQCPDAIRSFLRKTKGLHKIPVFSNDVDQNIVARHFPKFFIDQQLFVVRVGRYSKCKSTIVEDLGKDRCPHFHSGTSSDDDLAALDEEIKSQDDNKVNLRNKISQIQQMVKETEAECSRCFKQVEENRNSLKEFDTLQKRHQLSASRLKVLNSKKQDKDLLKLREEKEIHLQQSVCSLSQALDEIARFVEESAKAAIEVQLQNLKLAQVEVANREKKLELDAAYEKLQAVDTELKDVVKKYNELVSRFKVNYEQLDWAKKNSMDIPPEIKKKLQHSCPGSFSEVQAKLSTLREELKDLPSFSDADIREAHDSGRKVKEARDQLADMEEKLRRTETDNLKEEKTLLKRVNELVDSIDGKFKALMELMGNTGEIQLVGAGTGDFKNYGLSIMVKFANSKGSMQKLSADVQSGGEKSVTTALYMMALQELTKVPFRCVDEINQGMDETNERKIWRLLLRTATNYAAQYFYLAPKFPRQLEFSENMTIIQCMNGSVKRKGRNGNVESLVNNNKRKRLT